MVASKGVVGGTAESSHLDPQAEGSGTGTGLLRAQDPRLAHTSSKLAALPNPPQSSTKCRPSIQAHEYMGLSLIPLSEPTRRS